MANAATAVARISVRAMHTENGWPDLPQPTPAPKGYLSGIPLRKIDKEGYDFLITIPADAVVGTGLTFRLFLTDDGDAAALPVTNFAAIVVGLTAKKLVGGTDTTDVATAGGAEQTSTITLSTTSGVVTVADFAVANANLDAAGAGDNLLVRLRRIGSNAADTFQGRAILLDPILVFNTVTP